jgi:Beta-galactosidase/beta-glucuronidase
MLYHTHPLAVFAICLTLGAGMWAQPLSAQEFRTLPDGFPDIPYYVNNLSVYEIGQEEGRAFHIPDKKLSLNGTWRFNYYESPGEVPHDFFRSGYNDRKWSSIEVPSNWEMLGFGQAVFRNVALPFPHKGRRPRPDEDPFAVDVPDAPMDVNPTGAYRTSFNLPRDWRGDEVFLRFEKVASASFVWVNGTLIGYNEGAQEPSEYDVTQYVKPGRNTLAVLVLKYCDGYYLEDQDYWRLAGIFDDVWLYATPKARLWDWQVLTDFGEDYVDSDLSVNVTVRSFPGGAGRYRVEGIVSREGREVARMEAPAANLRDGAQQTVSLRSRVAAPRKWTSETPDLYDLELRLTDGDGAVVETVHKKIGFKKSVIRDGVFYLNGQPLKLSAECSHMQHPSMGHRMTEEVIRRDMEILKQFNFNAVRTSHYPPVNRYLELADEYGLYIIDETGDESHDTEYVSDMPEFTPMYRERVRRMVLRDRNHASVLFWSAGNESGEGQNITAVVDEGKRLDPTRFWMYGGNAPKHPAEDIVGPRYPSPMEHEIGYGLDTLDLRPSFMDEYLSVAGNGGGGMDDYWDVIRAHPRLLGGAIWDFVSVGLDERARRVEDRSPYHTPAHIMGRATLVKGPTGLALDLNKQDQWVQVYRADNVEIAGDKLTLTLDLLPRKFNRSGGYLITKGAHQYGLRQHRDQLEFYIDTGRTLTLSAPLPADWEDCWHNVTAVYDGAVMRLFVDGQELASQEASGMIRNLPLSLCIGRNEEIGGQDIRDYVCDARIDNVGVFADAVLPAGGFDPARAALWLDFEGETDEGPYWTYGAGARTYGSIWPDRTPQPEMWQMKKSTQPFQYTLLDESGTLEIRNLQYFTDNSRYETVWEVAADGEVVQRGTLDALIPPQGSRVVRIPLRRDGLTPGKHYYLTVSTVLKDAEIWAPARHEVAWEQFELASWYSPTAPAPVLGRAALRRDGGRTLVEGDGFRYAFDPDGRLVSIVYDGREMLTRPLELNAWRAPVANELDGWNGLSAGRASVEGYGSIGHAHVLASHYYAAGLDRIRRVPARVEAREAGGNVIVEVRDLAVFGGGQTQLDAYIFGRSFNGFEEIWTYRIDGNGTLTAAHTVRPQGRMPAWLPRLGVTLGLRSDLDRVCWYGRGPQASYPDRKSGYRIGVYEASVDEMYEPYLIPQDYGLRTDNRWVRMTDTDGRGIEFSMDEPFAFNAYPYSTENLTRAVYQYQLQRADDITLNLDYATSGVGDTARGIFDAYRAYPGLYRRTLTIRPVK